MIPVSETSAHLLEQVRQISSRRAGETFLIEVATNRSLTHAQFHEMACRGARGLRSYGVNRQDRVALLLGNSAEFAAMYFGCLYSGVVAVPVNPLLHKREIDFILRNAGIKLIVHSRATRSLIHPDLLEGTTPLHVCLVAESEAMGLTPGPGEWRLDIEGPIDGETFTPWEGVSPNDLFSITFTSGTTGLPKGVPHYVGGLLLSAKLFNAAVGFDTASRFYHVFSMSYMAGFLNTLICPYLAEGSVVVSRPFDAKLAIEFWDAPIRHGVNTLWLVPTMLSALLRIDRNRQAPDYCRKHIRAACVGTAPLPSRLRRDFESRYPFELLESYGLSETLFVATNSQREERRPGSVGRPLPGHDLQVFDELGAVLPQGEDGEIKLRTPTMMAGYLNYETMQPDSRTIPEWFATGDIGHQDTDGFLYITGRKKDLIIRGGLNISPRAVEDVLLEYSKVLEAAVIGLPHEFYGEEVVAVLKLSPEATLDQVRPELETWCKANMSPSAVPTKFLVADEFPRNATGKVQKHKLRDSLLSAVSPAIQK
jgi:long-chain acyl-CoA synthetase